MQPVHFLAYEETGQENYIEICHIYHVIDKTTKNLKRQSTN